MRRDESLRSPCPDQETRSARGFPPRVVEGPWPEALPPARKMTRSFPQSFHLPAQAAAGGEPRPARTSITAIVLGTGSQVIARSVVWIVTAEQFVPVDGIET